MAKQIVLVILERRTEVQIILPQGNTRKLSPVMAAVWSSLAESKDRASQPKGQPRPQISLTSRLNKLIELR